MPEYKTTAAAGASTAAELVVEVVIFRDGEQVSNFIERFRSNVADPAILTLIEKRVQDFIKVDDERIAKDDVDGRAGAIASSLDNRVWP